MIVVTHTYADIYIHTHALIDPLPSCIERERGGEREREREREREIISDP